jgi:hypothetical protein
MELEKEKRPKIFASREEMSQELTPLLECRLENKKKLHGGYAWISCCRNSN